MLGSDLDSIVAVNIWEFVISVVEITAELLGLE